jgi:hypothetical protein
VVDAQNLTDVWRQSDNIGPVHRALGSPTREDLEQRPMSTAQ